MVNGVTASVAAVKIWARLLGWALFARATVSTPPAAGAAKTEMALSAKVANVAICLNNMMSMNVAALEDDPRQRCES